MSLKQKGGVIYYLTSFKTGVEWVSPFPHEDLFIIVVIKVATNYVKSFTFLDRSDHLEAIIQKYACTLMLISAFIMQPRNSTS